MGCNNICFFMGFAILGLLCLWPLVVLTVAICMYKLLYQSHLSSFLEIFSVSIYAVVILLLGIAYCLYVYKTAQTVFLEWFLIQRHLFNLSFLGVLALAWVLSCVYVCFKWPNLFLEKEASIGIGGVVIYVLPLTGLLATYILKKRTSVKRDNDLKI